MTDPTPRWKAGPLTYAALRLAAEHFAEIPRKGDDTPYLSHLLAVAALVMEHGGSETQTAAALLHDMFEDTPINDSALQRLLCAAGAEDADARRVVAMVETSTDGRFGVPRDASTWYPRKLEYVTRLAAKPIGEPALLVTLADKVHNIESTLRHVRLGSTATELYDMPWFNAKAPQQKWYYQSLTDVFHQKIDSDHRARHLVQRLESAIAEIFVNVETAPTPQ